MPLHAARRRTINAVGRPYLPKGRKDARQRPISPERKTTGDGVIRQPNAKKARAGIFSIHKKAQSEKNLLRLRIGFRAVSARAER